ncbi:hypothetical protein [Escherichia sp. E1130]|uniref:hypothetical protein n=1 Tax=Escherichia sp. E1130 TaxID=2041645 RepID=UPI0010820836|nr:hypothetical protein [Escherichia sp. E1130]TGC24419.1 hypothetical protein CQJ27_14225 [Escherichia sp. E1130]TLI62172.1 hypothetical protein FEK66_25390 [Escherichia sp. E1130]
MGKLILTSGSQMLLASAIFNGHHKVLTPPTIMLNGIRGHAAIDGRKIFTIDDIQDFKINATYITLKGHSIPGQGRIEIDSSKILKSQQLTSENYIVVHDNKLPLKFSVTSPAKMPGSPPQDDPLTLSSADVMIIPHNNHVFADT